jgi:O-antigen ligase
MLGVAVALVLFFHKASGSFAIYGWYFPFNGSHRSAPFANRNHEAGWLLMVLGIAVGRFAGEVARGMRGVAPRWRDRVLWFSSNQANRTMLLVFAIGVIALAVLVSQSRSGAGALVISLSLSAWWNARRQRSVIQGLVLIATLTAVAIVAFVVGGGAVSDRIAGTSWARLDGRLDVWLDSTRILKDFWLTGTGFNTYGVAMLHYQTVRDGFHYIEAHNDYLQLAVEGGLLAGIPALILMASVVSEIWRRFREGRDDTRTYWVRVGAVAGIVAIAAQSLVDFTLQMSGAAVMFATLLAIAMHHPPPRITSLEGHVE